MKYHWGIIGHKSILEKLEKEIASENIAHFYLLSGPSAVGKMTVAKKMAGILQCGEDFCHQCKTCLQIEKEAHIDTCFFRDNGVFNVKSAREIISAVNFTAQSKKKIFVIENGERMNREAANTFLKTLEEPPRGTVFIITCSDVSGLPKTIVSRARVLRFSHLRDAELKKGLQLTFPALEEDILNKILLFANGKSGKALSLGAQPEMLFKMQEFYDKIRQFLTYKSYFDCFSFVNDLLAENKEGDVAVFLEILKSVLRRHMLDGDDALKFAADLSFLAEGGKLFKRNVNLKMFLENLLMRI